MFKTLRAKILITAFIMLTFLMSAFICHTIISRMNTKQLMVQNYGYAMNKFVEDINDSILEAKNNLNGLALIGGLFYRTDRSSELTDKVITRIFENYPKTLGGGIWFKPYYVDKSKKYVCFYAYRNKNNQIIVDKNFASEQYDYLNQEWYKQIISQVTPERNIVWTTPYFENIGSNTMMVTAGTGIYVDGELVGVATVDWEISSVIDEVSKMKPFEKSFSMYKSGNEVSKTGKEIKNSFALFGNLEHDYVIATTDPYLDNKAVIGQSLKEIPWYNNNLYAITYITYHGKKYIPFFRKLQNGMVLVICIPKSEMFKDVDKFYLYVIFIMLFIGFIVPALLYYGMNHYIIDPIDKLMEIANKIGKGEDVKIKIKKPEEFAKLAQTFDKMTTDIKTITKDRERINSELSIAKSIQLSSLPNIFPPFPDNKEFDIYAQMQPAKEVGGDFYDFYFIDDENLMFLIADVSGKGVPAALFMMTVKTLINNLSQIGYEPQQLINLINQKICETNKEGFFVTMLSGILNKNTGKLYLVNCGHNLPLIKRSNGKYEYLQLDSNIALGVFEDSTFNIYETRLNQNDIIFTYTDGITEAINSEGQMFGEQQLQDTLNSCADELDLKNILNNVKNSLKIYTGSTPQSDDITMLILKYQNPVSDNKRIFKQMALPENYKNFYKWLHDICSEWNLDDELKNKLDMCAEEIFANITFYAYPNSNGNIEVSIEKTENDIIFEFKDEGLEYNPLEKPDPDINLPPEERPLGGLGIFMVKNLAKDLKYERLNNCNILTLKF